VRLDPGASSLLLSVAGGPGTTYRVDYSEVMPPTNWQTLRTVVATNGVGVVSDPIPLGSKSRFYRAVKLP
jgi:hypothetical protein